MRNQRGNGLRDGHGGGNGAGRGRGLRDGTGQGRGEGVANRNTQECQGRGKSNNRTFKNK